MVCGCSSPMNCNNVCESTFLMKPNGIASICLLQVADQLAGVATKCFLDQLLGTLQTAGAGVQRARLAGQEFGDDDFLVFATDRFGLRDLMLIASM